MGYGESSEPYLHGPQQTAPYAPPVQVSNYEYGGGGGIPQQYVQEHKQMEGRFPSSAAQPRNEHHYPYAAQADQYQAPFVNNAPVSSYAHEQLLAPQHTQHPHESAAPAYPTALSHAPPLQHQQPSGMYGGDDGGGGEYHGLAQAKETSSISSGDQMDRAVDDIFSCARHNRLDEVERLLDKGVPVNVRDQFGNTILTISCQNGNKRVAKAALRQGADINSKNYKGNTPLHFCFTYGYGDTLGQYLISKGADPAIRNMAGLTCYEGLGGR
mmetsp:Transcript_24926/g.42385  ORF Transcript_24926/g.42385 Transcript_24926/m.42385 type:complete len:270 (-) Transcript_24926:205-1014(-)